MMYRRIAMTSLLMLGLYSLRVPPIAFAQAAQNAQAASSTLKRSVVESPSTKGAESVFSEVVDETIRRDATTSQRTRSEFNTDLQGRQGLVTMMEEQRVAQPDGGHQISRTFTLLDLDKRPRTTRREREQVTARGNGLYVTDIQVTEPAINGGGFVSTERTERRERRVGDQVVEREATTSVDPTGRGTWNVVEHRVLTRTPAQGRAEAVELVYRPDTSGNLVQSERIVSREWTVGAQEFHTDEIYTPDINNGGALTRQPVRQLEIIRTTLSDGGVDATRTVSQRMSDHLQVIERVVERSRPDGRGGSLIQQEVQRSIVDGRVETVATGTRRESQ